MVQGRKITNYDPYKILDLNISFERSLSKVSENSKIVVIDTKVMAVDVQLHPLPPFNV